MRVGVVGMGPAGLRTAMLLERAGLEPVLFEARSRPGGRLYTVREDGLAYDAGGEWIDADHVRVLGLLEELKLPIRPSGSWPRDVFHQGRHCTEATLWSDALEDDLRIEAAARELCRDLDPLPWRNKHRRDLDDRTLAEFLLGTATSARGLWWRTAQVRSEEGEEPDRIGLLGWLCGYLHYLDRDDDVMSAYRVEGGMSNLYEGMADTLKAPIRYNHALRRVEQDPSGVTLAFDDDRVRVDEVVLTLPPRALERIVFNPALPSAARCAVEACGMSRIIKICLEFSEAWWQGMGSRGSIHTDGPLQQLWDGTQGDRPVLTAYVCGNDAEAWLKSPAIVRKAYEELAQLCPDARGLLVDGSVHDWVNDEFALGGFSHLPPGYVLEHMEHTRTPFQRIHFAGEHTSTWTGFIEGALESAERVVSEMAE
ncbi:MAG: NAD(P)/FAD-dependent oxidoreductase [Fimbriimonadales bacterium]